jgi:hypothetical protein
MIPEYSDCDFGSNKQTIIIPSQRTVIAIVKVVAAAAAVQVVVIHRGSKPTPPAFIFSS